MTAPPPRLSPTAGLFNAFVRLAICRLTARAIELDAALAVERERGHTLRTSASYEASLAAGYIDRTGLE